MEQIPSLIIGLLPVAAAVIATRWLVLRGKKPSSMAWALVPSSVGSCLLLLLAQAPTVVFMVAGGHTGFQYYYYKWIGWIVWASLLASLIAIYWRITVTRRGWIGILMGVGAILLVGSVATIARFMIALHV